ncbi:GH92 family glycosyl hydrolase [Dactylosporangium siamense]|uniref:Alpha-1,2-mannosidase n=1 Tax=Dactylosporangium siamense TaxID=685454 RepID=A0A919UH35_9ACTN|nr:GH92 family glycosyl hydrolase [Dactylosporangium siamense]GIG52001.1 alpha-1,2-mannosidase [Dactylosporangium siamense]
MPHLKRVKIWGVVALTGAGLVAAPALPAAADVVTDPAAFVDPFIGSARDGNTWPGAVRPYGMLSWSPTSTRGDQTSTGAANGYQYDVTRIRGLSLTHLNGAGCNPGAAGDVPILPFASAVDSSPSADSTDAKYATNFSHADESAKPGRYTVKLADGVRADLAVTARAGVGQFTFPAGRPANLLFRTSNSLNGSEDAEITVDAANRRVTGSVLTGAFCGRRANGGTNNRKTYYRLYFSAQFDRAVTGTGTWVNGTLQPGGTRATGGEGYATGADRAGRGSGGWVSFASGSDVRMRIGISYVSLAGAERNRDTELAAGVDVPAVAAQAYDDWKRQLSAVQVTGGSTAQRTAFYTALYHSLLQPNLVSDVDGRYLGSDQAVHSITAGQGAQYGTFSGWDQYRAQIQLLALLKPAVAGDYAQSMYQFAQQHNGIWDRWLHNNGPTHVMTGDPAAPTLATFVAMGADHFDTAGAYASLYRQATVQNAEALNDGGCPGQCTGQRPALNQYLASRYAPQNACHCWGGAAETLENSLADFSLAQWAQRLGRTSEQATMATRAGYWRNTFNPATGYQQARNVDGSWVGGFSPSTDVGFAQGTSATYTWMVPQNVTGLAAAMGGTGPAVQRLDAFFHDDAGNWAVKGGSSVRYDPGNEPGLHAPWLYNAFGQPAKTQATTREIVDTVYGTGPSGLPGNDDLGTMSAWYVFAAIGIFPQVVGRAELLVGSPLFPSVKLVRDNGVVLTVDAPATTDANQYVQSASLDGATLNRSWLPESFVRGGGTLALTMGSAASTWGTATANRPPDRTGTGPVTLVQLDKCLDVNNSSTANGTKVQIWGCNGTNAQQWTVPGDGTVRALGKCLDVTSSGTANGVKLQLYDCNGSGAQQWTYVPASQALRNPRSGRCVDDPSGSTTNGTQLQLWDCNASNAQRITVPA